MLSPNNEKYKNILAAINFFKDNKKINITQCAKKFNIHRQTLAAHLKAKGLYENRKSYKINEKFFEVIDTEEKAYWLGFITADGCLKSNTYQINIGLSIKDINHLEKFKNAIEHENDIKIENQSKNSFCNNQICRVSFSNKKIYNDLKKFNILPRKTQQEKIPPTNTIPDNLINHYIRGIFDGDGWFSYSVSHKKYKNKSYAYYASELGFGMGEEILIYIKEILETHLSIIHRDITIYKSIYRYRLAAHESVINVMEFLYKDANIFLERKYEKYLEYCRLKTKSQKS